MMMMVIIVMMMMMMEVSKRMIGIYSYYISLVWFYGISTLAELFNAKSSLYIYIKYIRGSLNKFPDFFRMGTFLDSTRFKL